MDGSSIVTHVNIHRARHCASSLLWSDELALRAQDRVNREIVLPGSTAENSGVFGHILATRLNGNLADATTACLHAVDMWLVRAHGDL